MQFLSTTTLVIFSVGVLAASFVAIATFGTRGVRIKDYGQFRVLFAGVMLVALVLSAIGVMDILSTPYSGYRVSADYKVIRVTPNSPAALAGMKEGDFIKEIGGIPTDNLHQLAHLPRPTIGEDQQVGVVRDSSSLEFVIRQAALPSKDVFLASLGNLLAFILLAVGLGIYWRLPSKTTSLFFLCNFCFGLAFMTPPYFESFFWRNIVAVNFLLFVTMGFALFLHLTVTFPKPKPLIAESGFWELIIYAPVPLMAISYLGLRLFQPRADLLVNLVLNNTFALLVLAILALALAAVIQSYWLAAPSERSQGLGMVLFGSLLGVVFPAVGLLTETFMPRTVLPGGDYYPLLALLVSLSFGWAIWKHGPAVELERFRRAA